MIIEELKGLEEESKVRGVPIIGPEKGKYLLDLVQSVKPQLVLELGTANGYSGCILASQGAKLVTIEMDKRIVEEANRNFSSRKLNTEILVGDASEIVKHLLLDNVGVFDLVFVDFAKKKYVEVLEDCMKLVKVGGFIVADNISMEKCKDYKKKVLADKRLETQIIDIGDGLACSKKLK
jgi:predicted O-methyltransferase YrrM